MNYLSAGRRIAASVCCAAALLAAATSARGAITSFPGLVAVRIWEFSGGPQMFQYTPLAPQLLNQLPVLNLANNDFSGVPLEPYDVFYSDANGAFNPNGNYLTVEAKYPNANAGGGLNLGAVDLLTGNAANPMICRADILASFQGLGPNYLAGSEILAVDPLDTGVIPFSATTMGSTPIAGTARMRVTVGWTKIVPEPASASLVAVAVTTLGSLARRRTRGQRS